MIIVVNSWKRVQDVNDYPLEITSSLRANPYTGSTDALDINVTLEVTASNYTGSFDMYFNNVGVQSYREEVVGSFVRPMIRCEAFDRNTQSLQHDNVTVKIKDVGPCRFNSDGVEKYVRFGNRRCR